MTATILSVLMVALYAQTPGSTQYPEMTLIPGGSFQMGDHAGFVDPQHPSDELPMHLVSVDSFYIGTYDVTNQQYIAFLNAAFQAGTIEVRNGLVYRKGSNDLYCDTRQSADFSSLNWDGKTFTLADTRGTHPVVGIRWMGGAAYTVWLSTALGLQPCYDTTSWNCDFTRNGYRFPTEAEWEYAGRGGQYNPYYIFPWGNDADPARANWPLTPANPFQTGAYPWTTPVGFFNGKLRSKADFSWPGNQATYQTLDGSNAFGLYDMAGNVWQLIHDWYQTNYYESGPGKNPTGPTSGSPMPDGLAYHGMRGGNWYNGDQTDPGHARVSNRNPLYFRGPQDPNHPYYHIGFRVVRPATALTVVSAANFVGPVAPGSIASAFGSGLAGATIAVKDVAGAERTAEIFATSASQINFVVPAATLPGLATVTVSKAGSVVAVGAITVEAVAPGLFSASADGKGVAAAVVLRVAANGGQMSQVLSGPMSVSNAAEQVYLLLFGTGMRGLQQRATATIGGTSVAVAGPVAQGQFSGLDQVNLGPLPASLAGRGEVGIALTVDGKAANLVTVTIQ